MEKLSYPLIVIAVGVVFLSAGQVRANGNTAYYDDGIAASPKVRARLDERYKSQWAASTQTAATTSTTRPTEIAGSPRVQQMVRDRTPVATPVVATETVGYRATGPDGITASPKLRSQMDDRSVVVEIAPLK